jgi:hypothetical protein
MMEQPTIEARTVIISLSAGPFFVKRGDIAESQLHRSPRCLGCPLAAVHRWLCECGWCLPYAADKAALAKSKMNAVEVSLWCDSDLISLDLFLCVDERNTSTHSVLRHGGRR